ncbi:MAG: 4-hydroxy-tetrahydrodipicolinate synthase [Clostridiales bacterium]|nr:4-hydroxy-tetrahydrodipicolinate synthase [Clostridiales bacterium]
MTASPLFTGCATALVTPFLPDGSLDEAALRRLIKRQKASGMDALVLLGTTGEPCTLTMRERERVIEIGLDEAGSMPVIVGTGANDTRKAIEYARQARDLGATGQLSVTPYYNKATQTGLLRHYETILEHCPLPLILYNVPSRTGLSIRLETAVKLSRHPLIAGLKEASGDFTLTADLLAQPGMMPVYCGNDDLIWPMMAMGAIGAISVVSNVAPQQALTITRAALAGRAGVAAAAQRELLPLIRALFTQVNPIPVKAALSMLGLCGDVLRLPLTPMEEPGRETLRRLLSRQAFH